MNICSWHALCLAAVRRAATSLAISPSRCSLALTQTQPSDGPAQQFAGIGPRQPLARIMLCVHMRPLSMFDACRYIWGRGAMDIKFVVTATLEAVSELLGRG